MKTGLMSADLTFDLTRATSAIMVLGKRSREGESEGGDDSEKAGESSPSSSKRVKLEEEGGARQEDKHDSQTAVSGIKLESIVYDKRTLMYT